MGLGRLVPRKGFGTVIEALPQLPDTELVLAGGSGGPEPERERLLALAAALGVAQRVRMLPQVARAEVPALLRSADVVVAVPWYEPFGIVPLEAMACGRPVVASAVGGMLDTVVPGRTGLLVAPHDPAALAEALRHLLERPALRERLGRQGVERVRHHYGWDTVARDTLQAYASTLRPHQLAADPPQRPGRWPRWGGDRGGSGDRHRRRRLPRLPSVRGAARAGRRGGVPRQLLTGRPATSPTCSADPGFRLVEHDVTEPFRRRRVARPRSLHLASPGLAADYHRLPIETLRRAAAAPSTPWSSPRRTGARFLLASTSEVYGDPRVHPQTGAYWVTSTRSGPAASTTRPSASPRP